jgi:hypothetical protein
MKTQQGKDTIPSTGQKERRYTPKRRETIQQEVNKLLKAGFIRSVNYLSWLADLVLLEKSNGSCACVLIIQVYVSSRKLHGHMVSARRIDANPM